VCRKSYINPAVLVAWQDGKLRTAAVRAGKGRVAHTLLALLKPARTRSR
jgi:DNA topoisomerase IB